MTETETPDLTIDPMGGFDAPREGDDVLLAEHNRQVERDRQVSRESREGRS